jgi:putative phosphoesterase
MKRLILSDIHANYHALKAVLQAEAGVDEIIVLGDLVSFGPNPAASVDLIRSHSSTVVLGNHDEEIARYRLDANADDQETDGTKWARWSAEQLTDDQVDYLINLPEKIKLQWDGSQILLRHDLPVPGPEAMPDTPAELIEKRLGDVDFDYMFVGHVHQPYLRELRNCRLVNVGSIGQPEHGDGQASYVLWNDGSIEFKKIPYDVERTIAEMKALPLSAAYIELWSQFWRQGVVDRQALADLEISGDRDLFQ